MYGRVRPSAIVRLVVAVVVDAINRHSWRFLTHVRKKVVELHPSFADCNSAPAILRESVIGRIGASLLHRVPRIVGRRCRATITRGLAMHKRATDFIVETTATFSRAGFQGVRNDPFFATAGTTAQPIHTVSSALLRLICCGKPSEYSQGQVGRMFVVSN